MTDDYLDGVFPIHSWDEDNVVIICPVCLAEECNAPVRNVIERMEENNHEEYGHADYVHLMSVRVLGDHKQITIGEGMLPLTSDYDMPSTQRGTAIYLEFNCEAGHHFTHIYQFHKGKTFVNTIIHPPFSCDEMPEGMWRD